MRPVGIEPACNRPPQREQRAWRTPSSPRGFFSVSGSVSPAAARSPSASTIPTFVVQHARYVLPAATATLPGFRDRGGTSAAGRGDSRDGGRDRRAVRQRAGLGHCDFEVIGRLEPAALTTARALQEISMHGTRSMRRCGDRKKMRASRYRDSREGQTRLFKVPTWNCGLRAQRP
jgi:hypothetical protein